MNAYLISLPGSSRTKPALERMRKGFPNWVWIISPGVSVAANRVLYDDMREMECYGNWQMVANGYPARALGCRLAGLGALTLGLLNAQADNQPYFGVFQDDACPVENAETHLERFLEVNGGEWDCLWLDENHLTAGKDAQGRLRGARLCTGMIIRTEYAADIVPRLAQASCEWDVWMEREMKTQRRYFSESIVYQATGVSEITGATKWTRRATVRVVPTGN